MLSQLTYEKHRVEAVADELEKVKVNLRDEQIKKDKLAEITKGVIALHQKINVVLEPIVTTYSCLSCLDYLSQPEPLTLLCGHSICRNVSEILIS